eukprot:TRINITY_DN4612_c0_g2_i2.p1 TRINITY_DN4612_c0_g2~~TRINITY_DN4612_c0_g2_i2.p1  ORF type:complete len:139 (-),score=23.84 TRINITY_DN4612_c0_g2_i2:105-482(-)
MALTNLQRNIIDGLGLIWDPVTKRPLRSFPREFLCKCQTNEEKRTLVCFLEDTLQTQCQQWINELSEECKQLMYQYDIENVLAKLNEEEVFDPRDLLNRCPAEAVEIETKRLNQILHDVSTFDHE